MLVTARPPLALRSTLFPYTTLFRSRLASEDIVYTGHSFEPEAMEELKRLPWTGNVRELQNVELPYVSDRKSTRLNSSHVAISYAVFCLKKNIQTYNTICEAPNATRC